MLFFGNLHKGNYIKEMFIGSFLDHKLTSEKKQILCVTENTLDLYEYSYDDKLKINFIEPIISQDIFVHILNCKTITEKKGGLEKEFIILLTSCGIIAFEYNSNEKLFSPICSSILNMECEEKDKFMYIKTDSM